MALIFTISGTDPLTGKEGTDSLKIDSDDQAATVATHILQQIGYSPTIPDPSWEPLIDGKPNPTPQPQIPNTSTPGMALLTDLWKNYLQPKALAGARLADRNATPTTNQEAVAVVSPVLS